MKLRNSIKKDMTIKEALEIAEKQIDEEKRLDFTNSFFNTTEITKYNITFKKENGKTRS